jgi:mono/diheme cytochrome c family protein
MKKAKASLKRGLFVLAVAAVVVASSASSRPQAAPRQAPVAQPASSQPQSPSQPQYAALVKQYCVTCHNERAKTGGLVLSTLDMSNIQPDAEVWERVLRKLRAGAMPPQGSRRPDQASYDGMVNWLEAELDRGAVEHPNPGRPLLHRLNRTEYANAVRDLLSLENVDVESMLPADDSSFGFDNIADVLGVSSLLLERYLDAAGKISAVAVGDPEISPSSTLYRVRQDLSQDQHIEGLPLGTVGGTLVHYTFPLDAEYTFTVKLFRTHHGVTRGLEHPNELEITVDGERVHTVTVGGDADLAALYENEAFASDAIDPRTKVRVKVKAGQRDVAVDFVEKPPTEDTRPLEPFLRGSDTRDHLGRPHIDMVTIAGPFNATGPGDTQSRRRIFTCHPANTAAETPCATQIVSTLARRAYRGSVTDADRRRLMTFYEEGYRKGGFDQGIEMALRRILASPKFVFRMEAEPATVAAGTPYRVSNLELASRLSFFLWSSIPDDELLRVASQGTLTRPEVLNQQLRRMLADPKSDALISNFAGQWLQLRNLTNIVPNNDDFPDFDDNLRQAFRTETEMLFSSIVREDRNVLDLLTADYTFVNERLAKHYGIPNIYGTQFRRVPVTNEARRGLLGQGSILTLTSHAEVTSPVLRGKWVLDNLMGIPPPSPPAVVPPLSDQAAPGTVKSIREQMEGHRANPVCATCHKLMDPIGFALDNFDAVGAWRTTEAGKKIDASGVLLDGTKMDGVVSLRQALLRRPDVLVGTMTEKLLTYALGRGLSPSDMPAVRAIVKNASQHDYRFSSIVNGIVASPAFQMRIKTVPGTEPPVKTSAER